MDEMKVEEFNERLAALSEKEREHLKLLITKLVHCYTTEGMEGVLITGDTRDARVVVININCDSMEAASMVDVAANFFEMLNTQDAPPKEMFN